MNQPGVVTAETIERVNRVIEDLGYQPSHVARSLVRRKTNTLGIVMPDIKNTFFNSWFRAVEECAARYGYATFLCNTDEDSRKEMAFVRQFQAHRVDGIMIVPHSIESIQSLMKTRTVTVLVDRLFEGINLDSVSTDHYDGALMLTEYLISKGHRRIGVLTGPDFMFPSVERYRGFFDAMNKHHVDIDHGLVRNCEFKEEKAIEAVADFLESELPPTAIFAFNSLMTIGAIKAINAHRMKIPDDISLVCYDEIPGNDIFDPKITHVLQPIDELGRQATEVLINKIENRSREEVSRIFLKPELIIGQSCRAIA